MFFKKNSNLNFIGSILFAVTVLVGGFFVNNTVFADASIILESLPQTIQVNSMSSLINLHLDRNGILTGGQHFFLTTNEPGTGWYFTSADCSTPLSLNNRIVIASDDSNKHFCYFSTHSGNFTITATGDETKSLVATQTITVTPIDSEAPIITITGENPIAIAQGSTYTDAGATALDNIDGNITSSIVKTGSVDINTIGTYTIHYNVSDTVHNTATEVTRTVNVIKTDQATLTVNAISEGVIYDTTATLGTTGGSGTGAVTYNVEESTGCSITEGILSVTNASGTCSVTATKATDTNYNATTSALLPITLLKADSNITLLPTATPITYGQTLADSILSGGTSIPAGTFAFTTPTIAPNTGTTSQEVTFTPVDTNNYNEATGSVSVTVNKATRTTSGSYIRPLVALTPVNTTPATGQVLGTEKFNFTKFLKFKALSYKVSLQGVEVMELQKLLNNSGNTLIIDGKFGPKTKGAVIKFQIANKLVGDGVVGAKTRAELNK